MAKVRINGRAKLLGNIRVSGAKNAALAILPACILASGECIVENVPNIADIRNFASILKEIGADVESTEQGKWRINTANIVSHKATSDAVQKLRASYYLLGAFLARFGKAVVALPGGCNIGLRPIDQHIKGFEALGATVTVEHGMVHVVADKLVGNTIYLDVVSVGATINTMLAASGAEGVTIIENSAKEPEIVDVANFLNGIGVTVRGAGTDTIRIVGAKKTVGIIHPVIPDRIEAGTWMALAAASGGDITVCSVIPKHLEPVTAKLREMGVEVFEGEDSIRVRRTGKLIPADLKTLPYPGLPTDMQPQLAVVLLQAMGTSIVTESIFSNRFRYVDELRRMGAQVKVEGNTAVIAGGNPLSGAVVRATDLRGGAALLIAGLCAEGDTVLEDVYHVDRGYENIEHKLGRLGAIVSRLE